MTERTDTLLLKPADGRRVRHPHGNLIASQGERVPATPHYLRLRKAGDLVPAVATRTPSTRQNRSTKGSKTR